MSAHLTPPVNKNDHIQGNSTSALELVEYGDYQCEHCGKAYWIIKQIQKKMGADMEFVFRNFPLNDVHPYAFPAALAAEAAGLQNSFWEMHDIIFENQLQLLDNDLVLYADTLALNVAQFKKDRKSESLLAKVEHDFESGVRSGVNGTPSFFINGVKYNGPWDEASFFAHLKTLLVK